MKKILFGVCGSHCCHKNALEILDGLVTNGFDVTPVFSHNAATVSTRFGDAGDALAKAEAITAKRAVLTVSDAERTVTGGGFDCYVILPCTGNTLAKITLGITDTSVTMAAKSQLRNRRPVLIGVSTNDGLAGSFKNIASLIDRKNIYFIPFGQDAPDKKPTSLICSFDKTIPAIISATEGIQIQPVLV